MTEVRELWSARDIAERFGWARPNTARTWLSRLSARGHPIPVVDVRVVQGRHTYLYDSEKVLAARKG